MHTPVQYVATYSVHVSSLPHEEEAEEVVEEEDEEEEPYLCDSPTLRLTALSVKRRIMDVIS